MESSAHVSLYQPRTNLNNMADTYTQLYIQLVFAVRNRKCLIKPHWEKRLYKYITAIIQNKKHKMLAINGMPDHIHIFIGYKPDESLTELVKVVKGETSKWIKEEDLTPGNFYWQKGYGAFSYSRSHIDRVCKYIANQKEHHQKQTFMEEYIALLKKFEIDYNEQYIFKNVI